MAAVYFLQIINSYVASSAYVLFLHTRKRVPWITGVGTLLFQTYIDVVLLSIMSLFAIAAVPTSPIRTRLELRGVALGAGSFIATFWLFWGARLGPDNWLRWLYQRPSLASFRMARPPHYLKLFSIRFLTFLGVGLALRTVREFSYRAPTGAGTGIDAIHCGDRKFAIFTRGNRNDSTRLHPRVCPVRQPGRSVRAFLIRNRLQPPGADTDGTGDGHAAGGRGRRSQTRTRTKANSRPGLKA